ncbi:hypothetical protein B0J18DRAFT_432322 [Chaetomium sp. MPI-SDFR-AT-0129]|nr:hypothetical protein B0J18DRAFT_432322 [Chaetomium sp. MPI-SDFR-AT-0129]
MGRCWGLVFLFWVASSYTLGRIAHFLASSRFSSSVVFVKSESSHTFLSSLTLTHIVLAIKRSAFGRSDLLPSFAQACSFHTLANTPWGSVSLSLIFVGHTKF